MKRMSFKFFYKALLVCGLISASSCQKLLDVKPESEVDISNRYNDVYDANTAVIGIYGQLLGIADRIVVLNELRADLMSPTANADRWLRELDEHNVSAENPWADPKPFYQIIINCNDAMANFDKMLAENKINARDYRERHSDLGALRCWLYLQLGMHFNSVPYITDPIASVSDLKDESKYPKLTFDEILDKLIEFMARPEMYMGSYTNTTDQSNTALARDISGYSSYPERNFINKLLLLGDLYLWKGDNTKAAEQYKTLAELDYSSLDDGNAQKFDRYRPSFGGSSTFDFSIGYLDNNENRPTDNWRLLFSQDPRSGGSNANRLYLEFIWSLPFDRNYSPGNPFVDLFSNQSGKYQLTASKSSLDMWNSQTQFNGFPYDRRGALSVPIINGQPVIGKHLYYFMDPITNIPFDVLRREGRWTLYRGSYLILKMAQAANAAGYPKLAYSLVNDGVRNVFNTEPEPNRAPYPAPFNLAGRENPRDPWYRFVGTRTRANVRHYPATLYTNPDLIGMEDAILEESALEMAHEGHRWGDLLRVARRRNDPSYLANKIAEKLTKQGNAGAAGAALSKLSTLEGAYLPFKW